VADSMPFIAHMHELRKRLFYVVGALLVGSVVAYHFHTQLLHILVSPLNQKLYYSNPAGGLDFMFKVCLLFGLLVALPVVVYNLLKFITPAMPDRVRFNLVVILVTSLLLATVGICFAYFFSLPAALHFLASFGDTSQVAPLIFAGEYLTFVMIYLLSFAIMFQVPLIVAFVNRIRPMTPGGMLKAQRYIILGSFIIAAILTPTPDPLNQVVMATPMVLLYQLSVVYVWLVNRRGQQEVMPVYLDTQPDAVSETEVTLPAEPAAAPLRAPTPQPVIARRMSRMSVDGIIAAPVQPDLTEAVSPAVTQMEVHPAPRRIISDIMPPTPQLAAAGE
jgi:sec-independent protein translocase protein TatC